MNIMVQKLPLIFFILTALCTVFILNSSANQAFSLDISGDNNGISIKNDGLLFDVPNIVPGSSESSPLKIENQSNNPFSISIGAEMENGDIMLFDALIIIIKNDSGSITYYNGPFNKLKKTDLGTIDPQSKDQFNVSVSMPPHLGNEFQGKSISVAFIFYSNIKKSGIVAPAETNVSNISLNIATVVISLLTFNFAVKRNIKNNRLS